MSSLHPARPAGLPVRTRLLAARIALALVALPPALVADDGLAALEGFSYPPPQPGTYTLPVIKPAADGQVIDHTGQDRSLHELTRGAVTVMSFIYTRCASPRACPFATGVLNQIHEVAGAQPEFAGRLRLISMSFDPENDTARRMSDYSRWARERSVPVDWHFLTTRSATELNPILDAYGQAVNRRSNPRDPQGPLHHTLRVFLIDAEGRIRNIYSSDTLDPRLVLTDIRTLLMP